MHWSTVTTPPTPRVLRQFAVGLVLLGALWLGSLVLRGTGTSFDRGLSALVLILGLVGTAMPSVLRPVFRTWMVVAFPIGWLVSRAALVVMYYLVVTPMALVFRISGRDVLGRHRTGSSSYWTTLPAVRDLKRYLQQF